MGRNKKKKKNNNNKRKQPQQPHQNKYKSKSETDSIVNKLQKIQNTATNELNGGSNKYKGKNKRKNNYRNHNHKNHKRSYHKSELQQFRDQLSLLGLGIRNAQGDGNCLFRAIADQISGNENNQRRFRKEIVEYMRAHSEEFAPFYVGNYDAYLTKMSKNGIWGGNMELTAAAKTYKVDIVIHSFNAARYEILYQKGKPQRSIHLSYHNERHYASVRKLTDMHSNAPSESIVLEQNECEQLMREQQRAEIAWTHNGGDPLLIEAAKNEMNDLSEIEQLVVARTGCYDLSKVKDALSLCNHDIEAAVENIIMSLNFMANENKQKICKELDEQKEEEQKSKKNKKKNKKKSHKKNKNLDEKKEEENENKNNDDQRTQSGQNVAKMKFKCVNCCNEYDVLMLYLKHWGTAHRKKSKKSNNVQSSSDLYLDMMAMEEEKNAQNDQKENTMDQKLETINDENENENYAKYLSKYWVCDLCSFWNPNSSANCMVCSMWIETPPTPKKKAQKAVNAVSKSSKKASNVSYVDMIKKEKVKTTKKAPVQKKRNPFAWICDRCTFENKPANQQCAQCDNPKPKKKGKKKKAQQIKVINHVNEEKDECDDDDYKGWSVAGNKKCSCGSGKKYKKCCKKLQKHRRGPMHERGDRNNNGHDHDGHRMMEMLMRGIEEIEYEIANFSGKKADRKMIMKELEKAKVKKNELQNKLDRERNKAIKWQNNNKGKKNYHREEVKIDTTAMQRTIAI